MASPRPYYEDGLVTIYHGDCRDIMPSLGEFDLLLTDPPYGIGIAANPVRQKHARKGWDDAVPEMAVLVDAISAARQAIVWGGNYFDLPPHQCFLAWDKVQPENFSLAMLEQAWTNLGGPAKLYRQRVTGYSKEHPTQKPVGLMKWCITHATDVHRVLDPFAGSGTTGRAAKDLGIASVLIEKEEEYCEVAARRMSQESLFRVGGA